MTPRLTEIDNHEGFRILKHLFHDPQISNGEARDLLKGYALKYPNSKYLTRLRIKYLWHRVIHGHRYSDTKLAGIGTEHIDYRATNLKNDSSNIHDILLVSHEMSRTGAPRALLNMALVLKQAGYNPYIFSFRDGQLIEEAEKSNIPVIIDSEGLYTLRHLNRMGDKDLVAFIDSFQTVILNTMECISMFPMTIKKGTMKLGWVHECAESYKNISKEEFESIIADFNDIYIVGEHARYNALQLSPIANNFKNLFYCIEELKEIDGNPSLKFNDGKLHLLIAGTIQEVKGQHILGKAIAGMSKEEKDSIIVHCAGGVRDEWVRDELLGNAANQVVMEGNLNHDDLLNLLTKCDALICPSLDDQMPIVCTEAFQAKIPVLVSNQTGTASFIKEGVNGFIVKAGDADDLTRGLRELLVHRKELPEIGKRGYPIYYDNFSPNAFRNNILKLFADLNYTQ